MSVYRDIQIGADEVVTLRAVEKILRTLDDAAGGTELGMYADDLYILARRYDRGGEMASLRQQILGPAALRLIAGGESA